MTTKYWFVKIPAGEWMAGIHRFSTKTRADFFVQQYRNAHNMDANLIVRNDDPRKARNQAMRDLGLTKVRGALGGTYWE